MKEIEMKISSLRDMRFLGVPKYTPTCTSLADFYERSLLFAELFVNFLEI